ncbi:MAG: aldehyde dehydrogenase family protein [Colwellia sp.]|nr:aldehyde dehydrogenase family protein [Colwellia sp.]
MSFINGERCTTDLRIFVQKIIYKKFTADFAARTKKILAGDPTSTSTKVGALISKQHWQKVTSYIKVDIKKDTKVIIGDDSQPIYLMN